MKTLLTVFAWVAAISCSWGQGTISISPVPVTNGVTGTLADSSIVAALYYGPAAAGADSLMPLLPAAPLVNGYATFPAPVMIPVVVGSPLAVVQVRAWSSPYPTYEHALASGVVSVLAGQSGLANVVLQTSPGPGPTVVIPGVVVTPVPEPSSALLIMTGLLMARRMSLHSPEGLHRWRNSAPCSTTN